MAALLADGAAACKVWFAIASTALLALVGVAPLALCTGAAVPVSGDCGPELPACPVSTVVLFALLVSERVPTRAGFGLALAVSTVVGGVPPDHCTVETFLGFAMLVLELLPFGDGVALLTAIDVELDGTVAVAVEPEPVFAWLVDC